MNIPAVSSNKFDLAKALEKIDIKADWIGLREVREKTFVRAIQDENPRSNSRDVSHGVMVEALVNGQFAYAATNRLDYDSVLQVAAKAGELAESGSLGHKDKLNFDARSFAFVVL